MYQNRLIKHRTVTLIIFCILGIQTAAFALGVSEDQSIKIDSTRYEMNLSKNGVIKDISIGGETIFNNIGPWLKLPEYWGKGGIRAHDKATWSKKKTLSGYEFQFTVNKFWGNKKTGQLENLIKYVISYKISEDKIGVEYTIQPIKKVKVKYLFANIEIPTEMKNSTVLQDDRKMVLPFDLSAIKYKNLGSAKKSYSFKPVFLKKYVKKYINVEANGKLFLQLGQFPSHYSVQIKPLQAESGLTLVPGKPIRLAFSIVIPENQIDNHTKQRVTIAPDGQKPIKKLSKGLFAVGAFRMGDTSAKKINNFVENKKLVNLIKECEIPALRFNSLYALFGINGWTQRKPFAVDPVYPKDNGPLHLEIADAQLTALNKKLGVDVFFAMGMYNPAWMKKVPGTRWQFQKVSDANAWGRFAAKLARHAKQKNWNIKIWEIWNEADAKNYWEGGTRAEYINFYRTVVPYIEKADPDVKISGPVYTGGRFGTGQLMDEFLAGIKDVRCDYINWHHYGSLDLIVPRINIVKNLLKKYNRKNTGIFISELGIANGIPGDTVKAAVWVARAWQRILYNDVDYCVLWALSTETGAWGIINIDTVTPTPVYYLLKMFNSIARMSESTLIKSPKMPEGMESIAVKTPDGYAFFLIKNNKLNRLQVKFDYHSLGAVKSVELYSVKEGKNAQKITPTLKGKGFFEYTFHDFEILCVKLKK